MIKIIQDFLPRPLFDYMKSVVDNEKGMYWNFNPRNLSPQSKASGAENFKFGKTLYVAPGVQSQTNPEIYDKELMPLFGVFQSFMMSHMEKRCQKNEDMDSDCKLLRMKMNLYPNQSEQVKHGIHNDIFLNGSANPNVVTSVFNFTTCNGSTIILDKDEKGEYTKEVEVPSIENSMVMFNNPHPHYGITQNDTPARIVLNTNLEKAYVDPMGKPDKEGRQTFEPLDDYF